MNTLLLIFLALAGAEPNRLNQQILRGRDCKKTEALYHVAVCEEPCTSTHHIICGGTLIRPQWVLTAAHCVGSSSKLKVVLDAHNVTYYKSSGIKMIIKPDRGLKEDIILLKLDRPVLKNKAVIREPNGNECKNFDFQKMTFNISGLGGKLCIVYTPPNVQYNICHPTILQCSQIQKVPCPGYFNVSGTLSNNIFCAGGKGEDTRRGDSGGGLLNNNVVYGVVHRGYEDDLTGNTPGIYMDVCKFRDWIKKIAK